MSNKSEVVQKFYNTLATKGYKGKIVSAVHIPDIRYDITKHHTENRFDPEFYGNYQSFFEFCVLSELFV